jgi:hypothetical protein
MGPLDVVTVREARANRRFEAFREVRQILDRGQDAR